MLKEASPKLSPQELKKFYRRMIKSLHPDLGGDKEAFLRFLAWYAEQHARNTSGRPEVVKNLPSQGNYIYRCEEFTLEEILNLRQKTLVFPVERRCPDCEGTGYDKVKAKICGNCSGRGLIETFSPRSMDRGYIPCPYCGGRGRVFKHPCGSCSGRGTLRDEVRVVVELPLGLESGDFLYLSKERFDLPQDVYVEVVIKEHPVFKRIGKDLIFEPAINVWELLLSDFVEIPTLEGVERIATVKLRTTQEIVLKSRGLYYYEKGELKRGDLIVKLRIAFPEEIPREVRECLTIAYEAYKKLKDGG